MYLQVDAVESALIALAAEYPSLCELITLPEKTFEGRTSHALRIGTRPPGQVPVYYLTGGVHAREWGSSDILVSLATDLLGAYAAKATLGYGNKSFSAAEIAALVEQTNLLVFPCVNPDGRNYSITSTSTDQTDPQLKWRRNRNPAQSGGDPSKIGVDINRNQDFLWDFKTAFDPTAINSSTASEVLTDETYHGPSPSSEVECRNVRHLHDVYGPAWYVDLHSYSEDILYAWGDDESQSLDPAQAFTNPTYDHQRGQIGGPYAEYMPDDDRATAKALAEAFTEALGEVRGKTYVAKPSFSLYPTSGTNPDFLYSRHIVDPSKAKTLAFTVEWGTTFQPLWPEMARIIADVSAGLIGLGLKAIGVDGFIVSNRDTFSSYEVDTTKKYPASFYAIYDGFSPNALGGSPSVSFVDTNGGTISSIKGKVSATELEVPGDKNAPQRVTFTIDVTFTDSSAFTSETRDILVRTTLAGIGCVAPVRLVKQPNPYIVDGPINWLSTDLRVFQLRPGEAIAHSAVTLADPDLDAAAPTAFIGALLDELRLSGNNASPAFDALSQDPDASRLELARTVNGKRVCNFAIAKVRYRAASQDAVGVRVFFRMFNAMISDLSYNQTSAYTQNYRRSADGTAPLLGISKFFIGSGGEIVSIPFFAAPRVNSAASNMAQQSDGPNTQTLVHAGATEAVAYFGCWLDFNQTDPQFPAVFEGSDGPFANRVPILQLVRGTHQCLVAEIRFQPGATDPIPTGATPGSSDRLAQRNLAIVESDNPGDPSTHVVQHTLLVKPSRNLAIGKAMVTTAGATMPDELVLRFGDLPAGTRASLYFPDFTADDIIALTRTTRAGPPRLARTDVHTVSCDASAIVYVPLPPRQGPLAPGLLTLRLPDSVRTGDVFHADVAQHSGLVSPPQRQAGVAGTAGRIAARPSLSRRRVLGAFRMTTLVRAGPPLLARATRELGVLKYIREAIPAEGSWRPVFDRYIAQLSGQVAGLGGDPDVPPSPDDPICAGGTSTAGHGRHSLHGKVCEVLFDCFGDFIGFVLADCARSHRLHSTEPRIGALALRAYQEGWPVTVRLAGDPVRILEVIVGRPDG